MHDAPAQWKGMEKQYFNGRC